MRNQYSFISQATFDKLIRSFKNNWSSMNTVITDIVDKSILDKITVSDDKLIFKDIAFENFNFDIEMQNVEFNSCFFINCKFDAVFRSCSIKNSDFLSCKSLSLKMRECYISRLSFDSCSFGSPNSNCGLIFSGSHIDDIKFTRYYGSINFDNDVNYIRILESSISIIKFKTMQRIKIDQSTIIFRFSLYSCIADGKFDRSVIRISFDNDDDNENTEQYFPYKQKIRLYHIIARSCELCYNTIFAMTAIENRANIMAIKALNCEYPVGRSAALINEIIQTKYIGSRHSRTYYDAKNNLVHCGCWNNNGSVIWDGNETTGGSVDEFEKRVLEKYPDKDNEYHQQYMTAIKQFRKEKEEYKEMYKKFNEMVDNIEQKKKELFDNQKEVEVAIVEGESAYDAMMNSKEKE